MNFSKIISWTGLATALLASVGCGSNSSSNNTASGAGESCTRTSDCAVGLVCIDQICLNRGAVAGDAGSDGAVVSEGGAPTPARLGQACATQSDCGSSLLTCVPSASGGIQGGLCDLASYGIQPTGKACGGECSQDSDCCEIPYNISGFLVSTDAGSVTVHTCGDILQYMFGGDASICGTASVLPDSTEAQACNTYMTYCAGCTTNTWKCDSTSRCQYTGPCDPTAPTQYYVGFCPQYSRTGRQLNLTCNGTGTTGTCSTNGCKSDADCYGLRDVDDVGTCVGTDCVCFQGSCYFQCASDLDCQAGYACDATSKTCKLAGCTSDAVCKTRANNAKAVCNTTTQACAIPCANDHDCSPSSGAVPQLGQFTGSVCGSDNFCTSVQGVCTSNDDCKASTNATVNTFCVTPSTASQYRSAITN
jgi:hypothetical protein